MANLRERLNDWINDTIVVDCRSTFVALGTLVSVGVDYLELGDADMHDLRDSSTSRENYLVKAARHGIQRNRGRILVLLDDIVGMSRLSDVVDT